MSSGPAQHHAEEVWGSRAAGARAQPGWTTRCRSPSPCKAPGAGSGPARGSHPGRWPCRDRAGRKRWVLSEHQEAAREETRHRGAMRGQGRALSIVLHGAEAAATSTVEVPLPGLSAPQDGAGSQPSCPFPVLLPAQLTAQGGPELCGAMLRGHAARAGFVPGGESAFLQRQKPQFPWHARPGACWSFLSQGHGGFITAPLPAPARRDVSRASASKVSLAPPASSGPAPMAEKREQKSPQVSSPAWLLLSVIPSRHPSPCPDRRVTPSPLGNHPCPPQTPNLLVPALSPEQPRRRGDGWCGRSQAGAAGAPLPPQRVPGWQLRNCLSTNTRNCSEGFVQNSVEGKQTCS